MTRPLHARIDLAALRHNLQRVRHAAPDSQIMAVVKANAYGHGMLRIAQALREVEGFAVTCLDEAISLREAGLTQPISLLEGFYEATELTAISHHRLIPVVHCLRQVEQLEAARLPRPIPIWLKVDTGMHRLGFTPEEFDGIHRRLQACAGVAAIGLFSHLGYADDRRSAQTLQQCARFQAVAKDFSGARSLANSGGLLGWPETRFDWVRPGLMLYGISPFSGDTGPERGLRPVMTLASRLIAVRHFARGDAIGYGGAWVCPEAMPIGVVAAGYGDGYPRHASPGTPVLVNGQRAPLIGRVSMDMLYVDLRGQPDARVGDPVVLWGADLPVEEIARCAATIPYALVCALAARVPVELIPAASPEAIS
ncbi:MAG: alanine racemase [Gammaproteobacteria bacterium]